MVSKNGAAVVRYAFVMQYNGVGRKSGAIQVHLAANRFLHFFYVNKME